MTMRVLSFADGFSAATAPDISGTQENYTIANNVVASTNVSGLIFNNLTVKSVFAKLEVERSHIIAAVPVYYRQVIDVVFHWDGAAWNLSPANYTGSDLLQSSTVVNGQDVVLSIVAATGQVQYKSGNMIGTSYIGNFKFSITRIAVV